MVVASGIIFGWPSTVASIPSGYNRDGTLDASFLQGTGAGVDPGATGGATTHTHATSNSHTHTTTHGHSASGNSANATGSTATGASGTAALATHNHTLPALPSTASGASGAANPTTDTGNNDPANLVVIWIKSDGTPVGIPTNAIAFWPTSTLPTDFSQTANAKNAHLKGAAVGVGGGATGGSATHSHIMAHTHTGPANHTHGASAASGSASASVQNAGTGGATAVILATHTHTMTGDSGALSLASASPATSTDTQEPPWYKLAIVQNDGAAALPTNIIGIWTGTLASIPSDWKLCDGTSGTPDLRSKFIKGADALSEIGNTGGAQNHAHTGVAHTDHTIAHTHSTTWSGNSAGTGKVSGSGSNAGLAHSTVHNQTSGAVDTSTVGSGTVTPDNNADTRPPFVAIAYVQYQPVVAGTFLGTTLRTMTGAGS